MGVFGFLIVSFFLGVCDCFLCFVDYGCDGDDDDGY